MFIEWIFTQKLLENEDSTKNYDINDKYTYKWEHKHIKSVDHRNPDRCKDVSHVLYTEIPGPEPEYSKNGEQPKPHAYCYVHLSEHGTYKEDYDTYEEESKKEILLFGVSEINDADKNKNKNHINRKPQQDTPDRGAAKT